MNHTFLKHYEIEEELALLGFEDEWMTFEAYVVPEYVPGLHAVLARSEDVNVRNMLASDYRLLSLEAAVLLAADPEYSVRLNLAVGTGHVGVLRTLVKDIKFGVRLRALNNPSCPIEDVPFELIASMGVFSFGEEALKRLLSRSEFSEEARGLAPG